MNSLFGVVLTEKFNFTCVGCRPMSKDLRFHVKNYVSKNYCKCCVVICLIVYLCIGKKIN